LYDDDEDQKTKIEDAPIKDGKVRWVMLPNNQFTVATRNQHLDHVLRTILNGLDDVGIIDINKTNDSQLLIDIRDILVKHGVLVDQWSRMAGEVSYNG